MDHCKKIARWIKKADPKNVEELLKKVPVSVEYIGSGSFRRVYRINSLPIVIKFPLIVPDDQYDSCGSYGNPQDCLEHAQNEIDAIEWVKNNPDFKPLKHYLPTVYWYNKKTGVIVMKEYKGRSGTKWCEIASKEIGDLIGTEPDFYKNFVDTGEEVVLLDWGLMGRLSEWYES